MNEGRQSDAAHELFAAGVAGERVRLRMELRGRQEANDQRREQRHRPKHLMGETRTRPALANKEPAEGIRLLKEQNFVCVGVVLQYVGTLLENFLVAFQQRVTKRHDSHSSW